MNSSGFIIPSLGMNHEFCSLVATHSGCIVFDADYRKAPEHPFPAATQDAEDVTRYIAANPAQYDLSKIFLSGFSSGGNIALVTASTLGPERIKGVVAIYPSVDLTKQYPAPVKGILASRVSTFLRDIFYSSYVVPGQSHADPRISPILAPTASFPAHVFVACGSADALYDPAAKFIERLKEAGHGDAEFLGLESMAHAFDLHAKEGTEAGDKKRQMYDSVVAMINRAIGVDR